ncbi:MAG: FAD-dependent oxidoreductase, partial [Acidobacteriota bacterium]
MLSRRTLLQILAATPLAAAGRDLRAEVAILGASTGGVAAALAALRNGRRVVMTEETDWVGGQLTSQLVPPDEHPAVESYGGTQLYRQYRRAVRQYYRDHYPLTAEARGREYLNPGDGSVSRITHEPPVSLHVLEAMLAPWISAG